jgi:hypothetical protein
MDGLDVTCGGVTENNRVLGDQDSVVGFAGLFNSDINSGFLNSLSMISQNVIFLRRTLSL